MDVDEVFDIITALPDPRPVRQLCKYNVTPVGDLHDGPRQAERGGGGELGCVAGVDLSSLIVTAGEQSVARSDDGHKGIGYDIVHGHR